MSVVGMSADADAGLGRGGLTACYFIDFRSRVRSPLAQMDNLSPTGVAVYPNEQQAFTEPNRERKLF